ncbi:MAG: hypothetical protein M3Z14_03840 [Candidatus Eremiobacteraeota bacterium]|nr:hypothetical protein [Candidatus Eremiobacteraeota bacterium]
MANANPRRVRDVLLHGFLAGVMGGILIDTFLYFTTIAPKHAGLGSLYADIAYNAIGRGAYELPSAIWLGVAMHFAVSIAWGLGFAYALAMAPDLLSHPLMAGLVFGFVVQIVMQIVLAIWGHVQKPTAPLFAASFLGHTLFFGLPIALYFSRLWHRQS